MFNNIRRKSISRKNNEKNRISTFFFTFYRVATSSASTTTANSGNQNIIMMVPGATGGSPTIQRIPLPGMQEIFFYNVVLSFVVIIIVSNKHITTKLVWLDVCRIFGYALDQPETCIFKARRLFCNSKFFVR